MPPFPRTYESLWNLESEHPAYKVTISRSNSASRSIFSGSEVRVLFSSLEYLIEGFHREFTCKSSGHTSHVTSHLSFLASRSTPWNSTQLHNSRREVKSQDYSFLAASQSSPFPRCLALRAPLVAAGMSLRPKHCLLRVQARLRC
jgi:hypothetical protein